MTRQEPGRPVRRAPHTLIFVLLAAAAVAVSLVAGNASGTPLYAARAGRTCDNCHLDPGRWENPQLKDRLCTLSCQSCHVDPAGGGLRNAAGRFYGASTLPMIASEPRPTRDWDREFAGLFYRRDTRTTYNDDIPRGPATKAEQTRPEFAETERFAFGTPSGGGGSHSYTQGRYGTINADPMLRLGWDVRFALFKSFGPYEGTALAFPMQFDLAAAFQPVEHVTVLANVGARGRSEGLSEVFDDPSTPALREAFVLLHEFPYQAYVKAGRFVPSYGLRLDDHTAFIRRGLDLDQSLMENRVAGVEVGAAPNYPFVQASWFQSTAEGEKPDAFNPFDTDDGWGGAVNLGYRELGWTLGASYLMRERDLEDGGDRKAWGLYGAFNPWFYRRSLPFTYQFEVDRGEYRRGGDTLAQTWLFYQELNWLAGNGVNFLLGHSWEDPDREVRDDEADRIHAGFQVTPVTGITLDFRLRYLLPRRDESGETAFPIVSEASGPNGSDFFLQLHLWN